MNDKEALVEVKNLKKHFPVNKGMLRHKTVGTVKAVDDVSFTIYKGETLGLIGESGCGKSTLSRLLIGLMDATDGQILFKGKQVGTKGPQSFRKEAQMIFQDPYSSLDPRMTIRRIIEEPLRIHTNYNAKQKREMVLPLLEKVSIPEDALSKFPHEFSGGQRQRIGIARALVLGPEFIICDEPVSALDMSVQAQILNLFKQMQKEFRLTYLFVSHDMSVVKHISDRIMVMYLGKVVELASKQEFFSNTLHPYSIALMNAIPIPNPESIRSKTLLEGELPSPINPPAGCPFQSRCPHVKLECSMEMPSLKEVEPGHFVACHLFAGKEGMQ
ncbi:ATP-binding cassette domain-containing protein [Paenibacillus sp. CGMCC 1.16610]|uniref:ATP-binding cassette domain-containing protein n=1 Tax=Paenibacillus anseongense TaxID=2682845 RepID=A0ABW9UAM9_9BACL|nr:MULTISPECIES: oligopeptide/dipeptide ABC transporter ATP-binding protein [Paenibacillus]MBA2940278.1 ATP-binding cassette domain-containing protein [Paenibacillus sp. CGMCC 1.16610]MVQ35455.1 ATP-binding cassette domain-containing protein [Paenibacillus anseongense]